MKKILIGAGALVLVVAIGAGLYFKREIERASFAATLFSGAEQYENFANIANMFPVATMSASRTPFQFEEGEKIQLPESFEYNGKSVQTADFLAKTDTGALLVIENGKVRYEDYWLSGGRDVQWMSMSVAKSFISASVGIAVEEGLIRTIEEPVTDYVPSLAGSAYDGVQIKDILQMSSGARWNEDYSDPDSDINRFGQILALGGSLDAFAATLEREREPGTYNHYNSTDTQVLGMLLTAATGRTVTDYMEEKLWHPLGMEANGYWIIDDQNMEMVFGGLNATARDYAKLGELYRLGGNWNGTQIVSADWVKSSVTPDAPHLLPETKIAAGDPFPVGYGYQWWVPASTEGEYAAIGVYNQFIFVNPTRGTVIVKLSANSDYATSLDESAYREMETIEFFRAVTAALD
ncbi:MAG: serine hydrolase [Alphaproteobacteria bacterium]|nr:serine hydrolase [Alphaproteobacteria bacterium]MBO6627941.1 serine hydrolase [Alphaproteobacteria bacterium]MDF1625511.1 serine hydrolase [Parvibaculaceae bacterium]